MNTSRMILFSAAGLLAAAGARAWTSPGLGACYTPDDLVAASGGALSGAWPDYIQSQAIVISASDSLRWPAGLHWTVSGSRELRVHGTLVAPGTPWEPILIESQSGAPNSWTGLILDDAPAGCLLRCVTIRGGDDGLNCLGSSPVVEYCTLSGNYSSGLNCFLSSNPILRHCRIEGNSRYGVEITGGCSPVLEHCVIRGNNVEAASPRNAVSIGIQNTNSPQLRACLLEGLGPANPASGFSLWMSGNPVLRDCEIVNFRSGVVIQGAGATGLLERCWVHDSRYTNPNLGGSGVNVNTSAAPVFRGCCLEDNDWGVTITSACAPNFGTALDLGDNRLHGNGNGGAVWDFYNNTTSAIQARGNWWGTTNAATIALHIHDSGDGAYGTVYTDPILADSLFAPLLSPDLGFAALDYGESLTLFPPDHFRPVPGLAFALEGPGTVEALGDSLRWTPPAGGDTLLTLRLCAETPQGMSACDTLTVWLRPAPLAAPQLAIAMLGNDAHLSWGAVPGATGYRLERSLDWDFPAGGAETVWEGEALEAVDADAVTRPRSFYRVRALQARREASRR